MNKTNNSPKIKGTLFIILEVLIILLKVFYYICEATCKLFVPRKKKNVAGEIVLITGAGDGIGRELAIGYASLGATVICWDINPETNMRTMNEIKKMGKSSVYAYQCDVSDEREVSQIAEKIKQEVGDVTILINNAGIAPLQTLQNYKTYEISKVIDVNIKAHYWTIRAFLPSMIEKDHGHVVGISSSIAFIGGPLGTTYCATKAAVHALMESISEEVRILYKGKSSVKFTTIYPGLVFTNLTKNQRIRFPYLTGGYSPQQAATFIINAQRRNLKEKFFPSFLSVARIIKFLPEKALQCIIDFLDIKFDEDD